MAVAAVAAAAAAAAVGGLLVAKEKEEQQTGAIPKLLAAMPSPDLGLSGSAALFAALLHLHVGSRIASGQPRPDHLWPAKGEGRISQTKQLFNDVISSYMEH